MSTINVSQACFIHFRRSSEPGETGHLPAIHSNYRSYCMQQRTSLDSINIPIQMCMSRRSQMSRHLALVVMGLEQSVPAFLTRWKCSASPLPDGPSFSGSSICLLSRQISMMPTSRVLSAFNADGSFSVCYAFRATYLKSM